jgi:hypothetical protein
MYKLDVSKLQLKINHADDDDKRSNEPQFACIYCRTKTPIESDSDFLAGKTFLYFKDEDYDGFEQLLQHQLKSVAGGGADKSKSVANLLDKGVTDMGNRCPFAFVAFGSKQVGIGNGGVGGGKRGGALPRCDFTSKSGNAMLRHCFECPYRSFRCFITYDPSNSHDAPILPCGQEFGWYDHRTKTVCMVCWMMWANDVMCVLIRIGFVSTITIGHA